MEREQEKVIGVRLPKKLADAIQQHLKGKISKIARKAFETALGINGEIQRAREELEETKQRFLFLQGYLKELEEDKRNAPKKYKSLWGGKL